MPFDFDDEDDYPARQVVTPLVSVRGRILLADFAARSRPHRFGGALTLTVRGAAAPASGALHRLLTLSLDDPLLGFSLSGVTELPLVYGFTFDGCALKYRVNADAEIEMLQMRPRSPSNDWPYGGYPLAFPVQRFGLRDDGQIDPERVHELTWQDVTGIDPAKGVVAIVPPSKTYGVSLWGKSGDAEHVQVIFEIEPTAGTVSAYNQCT